MTRGNKKRLLRQATQMRIGAERNALNHPLFDKERKARLEEGSALAIFKIVPSVFAFAEKLNTKYDRPYWAGQRYGAK